MPIFIKVILIIIAAILPIIAIVIPKINLNRYERKMEYLKTVCRTKTKASLIRFKTTKNKWQAIYKYTASNRVCTYETVPLPQSEQKPKIGSKITIFVNPMNPQDIYNPKDDIATRLTKNNTQIIKLVILVSVISAALITIAIIF